MTSYDTAHQLPVAAPRRRSRARGTAAASAPRLRSLVVFVLAVVIAFFGMIYSRISLDRTAFELQELEGQIERELDRMEVLRVEAARLQDPQLVLERAEGLGLVYPGDRVPLVVDDVPTVRAATRGLRSELRALMSERP